MLPHDPTGKTGPKKPLPDQVCLVITVYPNSVEVLHIV